MVIWHDMISNSSSKHRSNGNRPYKTKKLLDILCSFKNRIEANLYVQRVNSPNILRKLKSTGILILDVKTRLTSTRKRNNPNFIADLRKIHPNIGTGRKLLHTILKNQYNFKNLIRKKRSLSKNRPSQRRRKKTQKKTETRRFGKDVSAKKNRDVSAKFSAETSRIILVFLVFYKLDLTSL